jgi:uncharacterized membrane protein (DUF2068 family)
MKRPKLVTTVALLQLIWGAFFTGLALWMVWDAHSRHEAGAWADAGRSLEYGFAEYAGAAGAILLVSNYGLWKARRWGWWLAVVADALAVALIAPHEVDNLHAGDVWVPLVFAMIVVFLLIPRVRKFYFGRPAVTDV